MPLDQLKAFLGRMLAELGLRQAVQAAAMTHCGVNHERTVAGESVAGCGADLRHGMNQLRLSSERLWSSLLPWPVDSSVLRT